MMENPTKYLEKNFSIVKKICHDNCVDNPDIVLKSLIEAVKKLESIRADSYQSSEYMEGWLNSMNEINAAVCRKLLFRAIEGNPSYVYATNYLIRRTNREQHRNISIRDDKFLKVYPQLLFSSDASKIEDQLISFFPDSITDRHNFLLFFNYAIQDDKLMPLTEGIPKRHIQKKIIDLIKLTSRIIDDKTSKKEPTAGQKALIIHYRYQNLRHEMTLMAVIAEVYRREKWENGSHKHVKNLYDAIGKGKDIDPKTKSNVSAIIHLLEESEREEPLRFLQS